MKFFFENNNNNYNGNQKLNEIKNKWIKLLTVELLGREEKKEIMLLQRLALKPKLNIRSKRWNE